MSMLPPPTPNANRLAPRLHAAPRNVLRTPKLPSSKNVNPSVTLHALKSPTRNSTPKKNNAPPNSDPKGPPKKANASRDSPPKSPPKKDNSTRNSPLKGPPKKQGLSSPRMPARSASEKRTPNLTLQTQPTLDSHSLLTPILSSSDDESEPTATKSVDADSYMQALNSQRTHSRAASVFSLSRHSLAGQMRRLQESSLPDADALTRFTASRQTASEAAAALTATGSTLRSWLDLTTDVIKSLDAEDDADWAVGGGQAGLDEVETAVAVFERLAPVFIAAVEVVQDRRDAATIAEDVNTTLQALMQRVLHDWEQIRSQLQTLRRQVELAREWEELWNTVLGQIGVEMANLVLLIGEMDAARDKAFQRALESDEESPTMVPPDDSRLLGLFARMQPLRASLDFLPMTLSNFRLRASKTFPRACLDLDDQKVELETQWARLDQDAQRLREELGEDRWIHVFRNAGRQAKKLCESVQRSIDKLREALDTNLHPLLVHKKADAYETKKSHYGPAIMKVLSIIEKGINDRQTVNQDILRVQEEAKERWDTITDAMRGIEARVAEVPRPSRDSLSSFASSMPDTPQTSPPESAVDRESGHTSPKRRSSLLPRIPMVSPIKDYGRPRSYQAGASSSLGSPSRTFRPGSSMSQSSMKLQPHLPMTQGPTKSSLQSQNTNSQSPIKTPLHSRNTYPQSPMRRVSLHSQGTSSQTPIKTTSRHSQSSMAQNVGKKTSLHSQSLMSPNPVRSLRSGSSMSTDSPVRSMSLRPGSSMSVQSPNRSSHRGSSLVSSAARRTSMIPVPISALGH